MYEFKLKKKTRLVYDKVSRWFGKTSVLYQFVCIFSEVKVGYHEEGILFSAPYETFHRLQASSTAKLSRYISVGLVCKLSLQGTAIANKPIMIIPFETSGKQNFAFSTLDKKLSFVRK